MIYFWISAVLLALLVAAAVVLPLWRQRSSTDAQDLLALNRRVFRERLAELEKDRAEGRIDAETLAELRTELERGLLTLQSETPVSGTRQPARLVTALTLILLPLLALCFYYAAVAPQGLGQWWQLKKEMGPVVDRLLRGEPLADEETAGHTLPDFIRLLQDRLQQQPDDAEGWFMLGISYMQLQMVQPAQTAFEHAWRLQPAESRHALALAQTRIFSNQGQLDPLSRQLLENVLAQQPHHEGALVLLGFSAYRSGDHATAVPALERLREVRAAREAGDGADMAQQLEMTLADARAHLSGSARASARTASIRVKVRIDRALAGRYSPDDTLYVFARPLNGPPMPLAVARRRAGELPLSLELDDSQSMMAQRPLSSEKEVAVSARISRHGSPEPQPGDLEAVAVPVRQNGGSQSVELLIRNVR